MGFVQCLALHMGCTACHRPMPITRPLLQGHLLESETYIGGKVEAIESGERGGWTAGEGSWRSNLPSAS